MWVFAIVPAITAAIIGLVTWLSPEIPRWKRLLVITLTVLTIGAISVNQWWEQHEKSAQESRRTATLENIGSLIADGEHIMNDIASNPNAPIPLFDINDWSKKCETFLQGLGKSYVVRSNSGAGLGSFSWNNMSTEQNSWLNVIQRHLVRLNEFSGEFSGQIPKRAATPF